MEWFGQQSDSQDTWVFAWTSFIWKSLPGTHAATHALRVPYQWLGAEQYSYTVSRGHSRKLLASA